MIVLCGKITDLLADMVGRLFPSVLLNWKPTDGRPRQPFALKGVFARPAVAWSRWLAEDEAQFYSASAQWRKFCLRCLISREVCRGIDLQPSHRRTNFDTVPSFNMPGTWSLHWSLMLPIAPSSTLQICGSITLLATHLQNFCKLWTADHWTFCDSNCHAFQSFPLPCTDFVCQFWTRWNISFSIFTLNLMKALCSQLRAKIFFLKNWFALGYSSTIWYSAWAVHHMIMTLMSLFKTRAPIP